jgi:hypothetical protein
MNARAAPMGGAARQDWEASSAGTAPYIPPRRHVARPSSDLDRLGDAARAYAARGLAVFPCKERSKEPACSNGFKDATTNPAKIRRSWAGIHRYNVAVATGLVSGVWVLDVDGGKGSASLEQLEREHGALPATWCSITASGCHLWFRADGPIPSSVSHIAPGLDVRADGGYAMAPPSVHEDGPIYRWNNRRPVAVAPQWLVSRALKPPPAPQVIRPIRSSAAPPGAYGRAALDREIEKLASALPGTRNHALNLASYCLHQLVAGGELDAAEVEQRLIEAANANGLMTDDGWRAVDLTIKSGAKAGLQKPRSRPQR